MRTEDLHFNYKYFRMKAACHVMTQNDTSWFQKDPPSLKLWRGKHSMAQNDMSWKESGGSG
jgi:hypothetical protein